MAAAIIGAITANQDDSDDSDDDEIEEPLADYDNLTWCTDLEVRIASSGDTQTILDVLTKYELREIRNNKKFSGRATADFTLLAKQVWQNNAVCLHSHVRMNERACPGQLDMPEVEVRSCYIAFLGYDSDGSGGLDEEELVRALNACAIKTQRDDPALLAAMSANATIGAWLWIADRMHCAAIHSCAAAALAAVAAAAAPAAVAAAAAAMVVAGPATGCVMCDVRRAQCSVMCVLGQMSSTSWSCAS